MGSCEVDDNFSSIYSCGMVKFIYILFFATPKICFLLNPHVTKCCQSVQYIELLSVILARFRILKALFGS